MGATWLENRSPWWDDSSEAPLRPRRDEHLCRCGCPRGVHEHWRIGDDCGRCGRATCPSYRRAGGQSMAPAAVAVAALCGVVALTLWLWSLLASTS